MYISITNQLNLIPIRKVLVEVIIHLNPNPGLTTDRRRCRSPQDIIYVYLCNNKRSITGLDHFPSLSFLSPTSIVEIFGHSGALEYYNSFGW